jgi:hypothetical protein
VESGGVLRDNNKSSSLSTKKSSPRKSGSKKPSKSSTKKSTSVAVRLLKNTKYRITGISGNKYVFNGAGSVLSVNSKDVNLLMKKNEKIPRSCCGGTSSSKIFELA